MNTIVRSGCLSLAVLIAACNCAALAQDSITKVAERIYAEHQNQVRINQVISTARALDRQNLRQATKQTPECGTNMAAVDEKKYVETVRRLSDIRTPQELNYWATYYYLVPRPDLTTKALFFFEKSGVIDQSGNEVIVIALMSQIFSRNSADLGKWVDELSALKPAHKAMVWKALWLANTDESKRQANRLALQFGVGQRPPALTNATKPPEPIEKMDLSPAVLDMLWSSFLVSGESKYVERVISALPEERSKNGERMMTAAAASWSLSANARQHSRGLDICIAYKKKHPEFKELDQIIARAK